MNDLSRIAPFRGAEALTDQVSETLTDFERNSTSKRLIVNLVGAAVLSLGLLIEFLNPTQMLVGQMLQALAALLVASYTLSRAWKGFFSSPPTDLTEQLVSLSILAAMAVGDFMTAALVPLLLEIGHLLEERSALSAKAAIQGLKELCSRQAWVLRNDVETPVEPQDIRVGEKVVVRPGGVIPVDGHVLNGHSFIDQSSVTGESKPEEIAPGDRVFAGTIAVDGQLLIKTSRIGDDTAIGQVLTTLQEVEGAKTPIVRLLERLAGYYLPAVLILACIVLFLTGEFERFITVLIVACPCALVLAAPSAMVAAMSNATRASILIKDAAFLENTGTVDTLILDKTGTITKGEPAIVEITPCGSFDEIDVLKMALAAAQGSRHPASRAIVEEANKRAVEAEHPERLREVPGRGAKAWLTDKVIRIGRSSWLAEEGVHVSSISTESGVWVSKDKTLLGFIRLEDQAKSEAKAAVLAMRKRGFERIVLLTGDKYDVAKRLGDELGLDDVFAEVLPTEKLDIVRAEQARENQVLMLGDGVNDALALSQADVGVAIGADMNDVALGGADVALHTASLDRLPFLIDLADETHRVIITNVIVGMGFSFGMLAIASLGFINPILGALLHNGGAIFVVLNSSRLLRFSGFGESLEEQAEKA